MQLYALLKLCVYLGYRITFFPDNLDGAGMKGKLGQALSLGLPVVTTGIGAEGMGLKEGETALIADEPEEFAEAVCRLYTESALWKKLSLQGRDYIEAHYGETAVREKLRDLLACYSVSRLGAVQKQ